MVEPKGRSRKENILQKPNLKIGYLLDVLYVHEVTCEYNIEMRYKTLLDTLISSKTVQILEISLKNFYIDLSVWTNFTTKKKLQLPSSRLIK